MKDKVKIYDKLDIKIIKNLLFLLFLLKLTILKNDLLFYTILHYQQHKNRLFSTIYICPHFLYKNLVFYIIKILLNFIKLQKYYKFIKYVI